MCFSSRRRSTGAICPRDTLPLSASLPRLIGTPHPPVSIHADRTHVRDLQTTAKPSLSQAVQDAPRPSNFYRRTARVQPGMKGPLHGSHTHPWRWAAVATAIDGLDLPQASIHTHTHTDTQHDSKRKVAFRLCMLLEQRRGYDVVSLPTTPVGNPTPRPENPRFCLSPHAIPDTTNTISLSAATSRVCSPGSSPVGHSMLAAPSLDTRTALPLNGTPLTASRENL